MTTTKTTPKCWVNPYPIRREESETPQFVSSDDQPANAAKFRRYAEFCITSIMRRGELCGVALGLARLVGVVGLDGRRIIRVFW